MTVVGGIAMAVIVGAVLVTAAILWGTSDEEAPLAQPFDGSPREAIEAGFCGSCRGTGTVHRLVPVEDPQAECHLCHGTGRSWGE